MKHPEDTIHRYGILIAEFEKIQQSYYDQLIEELPPLTTRGEELLFDYIFNSFDYMRFEDFEHYFSRLAKAEEVYES